MARRPDLRVAPPSPAVKRSPGVAGSPLQDACARGLIVFWRLIGGDNPRFRANGRGKDHV
jgi:hypothetical protein